MARIRSLKPTFWTDERVIGLTRDARLLCIGMISHADDEGRLLATSTRLAGDIFPADDLKPAQVLKWRGEIERSGLIRIYKVGGVEYAMFPNWKKHQRISKPQPSTLPSPNQARNDSAPKRGTDPQPNVSLARGGAHVKETGDRRGEERNGGSVGESSSGSRRARENDDDRIDQTTIEQLRELTGRTVTPDWAARVRRQILSGRDPEDPARYVAAAVRGDPRRYLPTGSSDPSSRTVHEAIASAMGDT